MEEKTYSVINEQALVPTSECGPNYEESVTKLIQQLKDYGATFEKIEVPENLQKFRIEVTYDQTRKNPYKVYLIDNMKLYYMYDYLITHKRVIEEDVRKRKEQETSKELIKSLNV